MKLSETDDPDEICRELKEIKRLLEPTGARMFVTVSIGLIVKKAAQAVEIEAIMEDYYKGKEKPGDET